MTLKSIFAKPVDRYIEGVIKADDETSLRQEIEEYVLTNEVERRLEDFLEAYNAFEGANGVWISGFFGSGKSHLLKMLAFLLENREIDSVNVLDLFLSKCGDNEILRGDLRRAASIPSKSILFNIDQKADVISKTQFDALLSVFVKVFDETCGYYGRQGYIAQFERDLDKRDLYEDFKSKYKDIAGLDWSVGRDQALLESQNISKAYADVTSNAESPAQGILEQYRSQYRVSIEDFADQVKDYVDQHASDFRLNFFVDEVGQFIAENVKLMTNLQTIAESLATKCKGRAWVIVTAQEDMDTVVGEMGRQQSNDFSKIQARFASRMKLTSADVDEVIQKRLLMKNDEGIGLLSDLYHAQSNNFKTLFDFADGSQTYRNFRDRDHFIHSYPFPTYQFPLFQSAIQSLSEHNAFEGRHSSVGERSMLGVFQQVAILTGDGEIGQLSTFDLMFEGIRTALKTNIQGGVIQAERHLESKFAVRLLKALFLVKYVREFKPTIRNISVLMLDRFDRDLPQLRKDVEEALNLLEQQTYIQRNGDLYEYLTDEEKDVEQEIKNTEVEASDVADELEKIVFEHVIRSRKIRGADDGQDYSYSRKLDDRLHGREHELAIHVITPFHENVDNEAMLKMQSMGRDELLVLMPPDARIVRDMLMYKRTEKYIRQNNSVTLQETVKRILSEKGLQNAERSRALQQHARTMLGKAKLLVAGSEIEVGGEDPQNRITTGFHELITRVYPNLRMLQGINYKEEQVRTILSDLQGTLEGTDVVPLSEAAQEVVSFIQSNNRGGVRTTLKNLLERFERKPYGWSYPGILCTVANLCARSKVEVRSDGNILEGDDLERALRNTHGHGNVVLEPQIEFTGSQVRSLKEFYEDFFDSPPQSNEARDLGRQTGAALQQMVNELTPLASQVSQYGFLIALAPVLETLKDISSKPYTWYLTELLHQKDDLLDVKEKTIEPIRRFMSGSQKGIFDTAQKFVQEQEPNFDYVDVVDTSQLIEALADPECFKGNHMQNVKTLVDGLHEKFEAQVAAEISKARDSVDILKSRLCGMSEFSSLTLDQQEQIARPFEEFDRSVDRQRLIAVIRDTFRRFEEKEYQDLLSKMSSWATPEPKPGPTGENGSTSGVGAGTGNSVVEPPVEYITGRSIVVPFEKAWLADESDVDMYIGLLREAWLESIRGGKRIQV